MGLPRGADQPYRILPDEASVEDFLGAGSFRSSFYVAEENLQLMPLAWESEGQSVDVDAAAVPEGTVKDANGEVLDQLSASRVIEHRFMSLYFQSYYARGRFIGSPRLLQFPDQAGHGGAGCEQGGERLPVDLEELQAVQKNKGVKTPRLITAA